MNNRALVYPLRLEEVTAYIRKAGWRKLDHPNDRILVFLGPIHDDSQNEIKLVLPNGNEFPDAPDKIQSAVQLLSAVENLPEWEIVQKIKNRGVDILRQRIINSTPISSLPLESIPYILRALRDLIFYSACMEQDPQSFFDKGRKIGTEFTKKCRFGHTFFGSFGLSIEMPIPPNIQQVSVCDKEQIPLERRIMERIARGLQFAVRSVNEGDVGILTTSYHQGFNANLYEVMIQLSECLADFTLAYSMTWSTEYRVSEDVRSFSNIQIDPIHYRPFFESAAKTLRTARESVETEVMGNIIQLHAELEDDLSLYDVKDRQITLIWEMEKGRKIQLHVSLTADEYRLACDAHRDGRQVIVKGKPEKQGKLWILTSPSGFQVKVD